MDELGVVDSIASEFKHLSVESREDATAAVVASNPLRGDDAASATGELQSGPAFVMGLADMAGEVLRCAYMCGIYTACIYVAVFHSILRPTCLWCSQLTSTG